MVLEFELPDTGEGVTEGKFLEWLVEEGEHVDEDQTLAEVETDKAVVDVPAPATGTIKQLKVKPGDTVDVGEVIMLLDTGDGSEAEETVEKDTEESEDEKKDEKEEKKTVTKSSSGSKNVLALPKVRKLAEEKNIDLSSIKTGERITEEEVLDAAGSEETSDTGQPEKNSGKSSNKDVKATPAVRKLAREEDIDIEKVEGSGRGGKVTRDDILGFKDSSEKKDVTEKVEETSGSSGDERVEMSGLEKAVASKMEESRFTAPHVTHVEKADVTELVDLREREKDKFDVHLTYLPFIMKAVVEGLREYPKLNAELDEENNEILLKKDYNFNIAVDTDRGLMVPVVKAVDDKSIVELAEGIGDAAKRAKNGKVGREEMAEGTFSITNLGVIGGEEFTPIINPPQTAIIGIGSIKETAEVVDDEVVPRKTVKLSLSYDHRVIDGATGARFMNTVVENLENPEQLLMRL